MEKDMNQEIKTALYDGAKIEQVLNFLNTLPVAGVNNITGMGFVFDVLTHPIIQDNSKNEANK